MKKSNNIFSLILITSLFIAACGSEDVKKVNCTPNSVFFDISDSVAFVYNSSQKLSKILKFSGNFLNHSYEVEYDSKSKISKVSQYSITYYQITDTIKTLIRTLELQYNANGTVNKAISTNVSNFKDEYLFKHDEKGRLTEMDYSDELFRIYVYKRYVYDANDNVSQIFYLDRDDSNNYFEVLGRENLAFDNKSTFFSGSKDLEFIYTYILGYIPGRNNVLKFKATWGDSGIKLNTPNEKEVSIKYDNNGRISEKFYLSPELQSEKLFRKVYYNCK